MDPIRAYRWREVKDQVLNKAMSLNGFKMSLLGGGKTDAGRRPLQKFERGGNGHYSTSAPQEERENGGEGDESLRSPHKTY